MTQDAKPDATRTVTREQQVTQAFLGLANELAADYDMIDLLSGLTADCARILDVASAGLLLADPARTLHVIAASSDETRSLEVFQLQRDEGPCLDCFHDGSTVMVADLRESVQRWPQFAPAALEKGFRSVHALPMRLRDTVLGTLGLFGDRAGALNADDLALGQALAHVASVAIANDRTAADKDLLNGQLQSALASRIVLEQAKGVLAQVGDMDMDRAFALLRSYARDTGQRLTAVAGELVNRRLQAQVVLQHGLDRQRRRANDPVS